jgi:hypothetical protein
LAGYMLGYMQDDNRIRFSTAVLIASFRIPSKSLLQSSRIWRVRPARVGLND